jgi:hypothetical protein
MTKHSALTLLLLLAWSLPVRADDAGAARERYTRASNAYDLGHFNQAGSFSVFDFHGLTCSMVKELIWR